MMKHSLFRNREGNSINEFPFFLMSSVLSRPIALLRNDVEKSFRGKYNGIVLNRMFSAGLFSVSKCF